MPHVLSMLKAFRGFWIPHPIHTASVWDQHNCSSGHRQSQQHLPGYPCYELGFFLARHKKDGTKLYCFPISLALLADKREKGQWWSLWAHASFITSGCLLYQCHCPGALPALCMCYIQSPPLPQTLKVTAGDKQRCRWVSELIWGNHHYIPAVLIYHWGLCKFSTSWGQVRGRITPEGAEVLLQDAVEMPRVLM